MNDANRAPLVVRHAAPRVTAAAVAVLVLLSTGLAAARAGAPSRPARASRVRAAHPRVTHARRRARAARSRAVPAGFVGMNLDGPLFNSSSVLSHTLGQMVASGIESVRLVFSWAQAQPQRNGPYDLAKTDTMVEAAAHVGLSVLPIVIYTPSWDAQRHKKGRYAAPADDAPYAGYLTALVQRYGPKGTFWSAHPGLPRRPIREWQIWNEPNLLYYWASRPWVPGYVNLLAAAHAAVKAADPGAKVVLAGFPDTAWSYLSQIYKRHARNDFEVVAAHPYTMQPSNVIRFLKLMRATMQRNGDARKPLLVTEAGWSSSYPGKASDGFCCQVTTRRQAQDIAALLPLLAQNRARLHLLAFYYYTWAGQEYIGARSFNYAGLFDINYNRLVAKPAYPAFRTAALSLERCRRKGTGSTRCLRGR